MNTKTHNTPTLRRAAAIAFASCLLTTTAFSQTLIDDFTGPSVNTNTWTFGSSDNLGSGTVSDGNLTLAVGQTANSKRAVLVSDTIGFNPFAQKLTVNLGGISVGGDPGASFIALYAVIGRTASDTGGTLTNAALVGYSAGGAYGAGGALGVSVLKFQSSYRLQIMDSGSNATVQQTQVNLSGAPTNIVWEIDGAGSTWSVTLSGATFTSLGTNQLGVIISPDFTSIAGTFSNFTLSGLTSGDDIISRFVLGANNGTGVTSGASATFDSVSVTAIPESSTYAFMAAVFSGVVAIVRRQKRNAN